MHYRAIVVGVYAQKTTTIAPQANEQLLPPPALTTAFTAIAVTAKSSWRPHRCLVYLASCLQPAPHELGSTLSPSTWVA